MGNVLPNLRKTVEIEEASNLGCGHRVKLDSELIGEAGNRPDLVVYRLSAAGSGWQPVNTAWTAISW